MYKDHETPKFWKTYNDALRKYLQKRLADKSLIDDILHEVYLKVFVFCKRYDFSCEKAGVANLRSWIFQVCHNTMVDHLKRQSKYSYLPTIFDALIEPPSEQSSLIHAADLIRKLPPRYATAVYLDTIANMNQNCIAQKLGLGISATKSRIQRGKQMLKAIYQSQIE